MSWGAMWFNETGSLAASDQACHMRDLPSKCQLLLMKNEALLLAIVKLEEILLTWNKYKEISEYEMILPGLWEKL